MEKYIRNGKVAILTSPGYGAGWSTWNKKELACDKRVVEFWLNHKKDKDFMREINDYKSEATKRAKKLFESWGYEDVYFGGFNQIELTWLNEGTDYIITEYDGSESLITLENRKWEKA